MANPESELVNLFLSSIKKIIHGNHVDGDELKLIKSQVLPFDIRVSIYWNFQAHWTSRTVAGGQGASINHGRSEASFDQQHEKFVQDACYNRENRYKFLNQYKAYDVQGLIHSDNNQHIADYPTHSFWYYCSTCNGDGKLNCSTCSGSGRTRCYHCHGSGNITETRYNGNHSYHHNVSCSWCRGSGKSTCSNCRGSGENHCSPCGAHGYFTYYRDTSIIAVPTARYLVTSEEHSELLVNYLIELNRKFLYEKIRFSTFAMEAHEQTYECIRYYGNSFITDILTDLRNQQHHILGFSNPPLPFKRSAIFDQLFIEEISALEKYQDAAGKISKSQALKFFNQFSGQPALDLALKDIAIERKATTVDHSHLIKKACSYFITDASAQRLAHGIHSILDKVSPAYHGLTWAIFASIFFLIAAIFVEFKIEQLPKNTFGDYFLNTFVLLGFTFICFALMSLVITLISNTITMFKRRNVPKEYRQSMRNLEPFSKSLVLGLLTVTISSFYGFATLKDWTPKLDYKLIAPTYQGFNHVLPQNTVQKFCILWVKEFRTTTPPHICSSKYFINYTHEFGARFYPDPVRIIQNKIRQDQPDFKADGVMGEQTRLAALEWLKKRGIVVDPNLSVHELAQHMDDFDLPY